CKFWDKYLFASFKGSNILLLLTTFLCFCFISKKAVPFSSVSSYTLKRSFCRFLNLFFVSKYIVLSGLSKYNEVTVYFPSIPFLSERIFGEIRLTISSY